jgi:type IV pilus assembly protein PilQ
MKRLSTLCLATWLVAGLPHALAGHPSPFPTPATLKSITVTDVPMGKEVLLQVDGKYTFHASDTVQGVVYVDLVDTNLGSVPASPRWEKGPVVGYQLREFKQPSGDPTVRVEIQTRSLQSFSTQQGDSGLRLLFAQATPGSPLPSTPAKPPLASPATSAEGPALVTNIVARTGPSGEVAIEVATSKTATFHRYRYEEPDRLVIDLEGTKDAVPRNLIDVSSPVVKDVRVAQFKEKDPGVVRVVADLSGDPICDARPVEGGLLLEIRPRHMPARRPDAVPSSGPAKENLKGGQLPIAQAHPLDVMPGLSPAQANLKGTPTLLPQPHPNDATPGSGQAPATLKAGAAPPPQAHTPDSTPGVSPTPAPQKGSAALPVGGTSGLPAASGGRPAYTGELISLDLKDVDLKDFLRLIHELSGLNIVVDPNVSGSVTLVLDSVPWDQALDIVLRNSGLSKVLEGNVLRIAKAETLKAEQQEANKSAPLVTLFRPMNYAKAKEVAALLKTLIGGGLSERGSAHVDDRTNTLIISDVASQVPIIQQVLSKLDTKTKQVSIEARIVLASSSFQRTLSTALVEAATNHSGSTTSAGQTGSTSSVTPSTSAPPSFTLFPNATTGFGAVAITNFSQRYMIDAAISAAEIRSQAKTLSRPSLITQENTQGMVQQGTQIPVQTSINNTIAVQYVDATLKLMVTPQVTDDGHIFLNIKVQNASPGTIITGAAVSINIQEATTQVLVPDGGTVVFGGVTVTQRQNSSTGIPLLGNIPILGNLFKTSNVQDSDQELLFFVSPRLLTT